MTRRSALMSATLAASRSCTFRYYDASGRGLAGSRRAEDGPRRRPGGGGRLRRPGRLPGGKAARRGGERRETRRTLAERVGRSREGVVVLLCSRRPIL